MDANLMTSFRKFWERIKSRFAEKSDIDLIISKVATPPVYIAPEMNINQSNISVEMGSNWSNTRKATFKKNDAGDLIEASFDGVDFTAEELAAGEKTASITRNNITSVETISASFKYGQGPIKTNNFDLPDERGRIPGATVIVSFKITPKLHYFYGVVDDNWTITSSNVRDLTNIAPATTIRLETGTLLKKFVVAVPSTVGIVDVKDETSMMAPLTDDYVLQGTYEIEDKGGNPRSYKVYIMQMAVTYDTPHIHIITIG